MQEHNIHLYTEHLSWCTDSGHLYDLLPIPCTDDAVSWVAGRIRQAQDILEMPIGIENASYYMNPPNSTMSEEEFITAIINESGCFLHLDVNNIYVNSQNFSFNPETYLQSLPLDKVGYLHVAGHYQDDSGVLIDTHGATVIDPVWDLLEKTYQAKSFSVADIPICLERDFNIPSLDNLFFETDKIREIQKKHIIV